MVQLNGLDPISHLNLFTPNLIYRRRRLSEVGFDVLIGLLMEFSPL